MTNFSKNDIVIVKFPFASSLKYKARPAVIISSDTYNQNRRDTFLILAISSNLDDRLEFEMEVKSWKDAGLLKPSIFKSSIATIEKTYIIQRVGKLNDIDVERIEMMLDIIFKNVKEQK